MPDQTIFPLDGYLFHDTGGSLTVVQQEFQKLLFSPYDDSKVLSSQAVATFLPVWLKPNEAEIRQRDELAQSHPDLLERVDNFMTYARETIREDLRLGNKDMIVQLFSHVKTSDRATAIENKFLKPAIESNQPELVGIFAENLSAYDESFSFGATKFIAERWAHTIQARKNVDRMDGIFSAAFGSSAAREMKAEQERFFDESGIAFQNFTHIAGQNHVLTEVLCNAIETLVCYELPLIDEKDLLGSRSEGFSLRVAESLIKVAGLVALGADPLKKIESKNNYGAPDSAMGWIEEYGKDFPYLSQAIETGTRLGIAIRSANESPGINLLAMGKPPNLETGSTLGL